MIPEGWNKEVLGNGIILISGQHIDANDYSEDSIGIPYLTGPSDFPNGRIVVTKYTSKPKVLCIKGDILLTVKGSGTGQIVKSDNSYCISRQLMAVRSLAWDSDFIYYVLLINTDKYAEAAAGLIPGITRDDVLNTEILLPPLAEQRKIAAILSTWDEAIGLTEALIRALERRKQALMQLLLTGAVRFQEFTKQKELNDEENNDGNTAWETTILGDCCFVTKLAGYEYTEHFDYSMGGEVIVIRVKNIRNGRLDLSEIHTISKEVSNALPRSQLMNGDLVMGYVGSIGDVALIKEDGRFHLGPNVAKITPDPKRVNATFLFQQIQGKRFQDNLLELATLTSQPALSMTNLRTASLILPDITEQEKIAFVLSICDLQIDLLKNQLSQLQVQKRGLMQQLLTGAVRVEV